MRHCPGLFCIGHYRNGRYSGAKKQGFANSMPTSDIAMLLVTFAGLGSCRVGRNQWIACLVGFILARIS